MSLHTYLRLWKSKSLSAFDVSMHTALEVELFIGYLEYLGTLKPALEVKIFSRNYKTDTRTHIPRGAIARARF